MKEYFEYLAELQAGGTMNMMWAPTMLQADFDLEKKEAREIFSKWCESLKYVCFRLDNRNVNNNGALPINKKRTKRLTRGIG